MTTDDQPVGSQGVSTWNVTTPNRNISVHGELVFTRRGAALIWHDCDACGVPHLILGLAPGWWGSIVPEDNSDA